jgi:hypothetical protein
MHTSVEKPSLRIATSCGTLTHTSGSIIFRFVWITLRYSRATVSPNLRTGGRRLYNRCDRLIRFPYCENISRIIAEDAKKAQRGHRRHTSPSYLGRTDPASLRHPASYQVATPAQSP